MRRLADLAGLAAVFVISGVLLIALIGSSLISHEVCVPRGGGEVTYGDWKLDPLAWLSVVRTSPEETCEFESAMHHFMGKLPVVGEGIERVAGGPENPEFYDNR